MSEKPRHPARPPV
jgi:hypothetical protein